MKTCSLLKAQITTICKRKLKSIPTFNFDDDVIQEMEQNITEKELYEALKEMNKDKAPGMDGLTVEFYLTYWNIIKNELTDVFAYCKNTNCLSESMNLALIRLIYKNKGERNHLKNWRPISLLNVDYKILTKVLTKRMSKLMPFLIEEDQTCGVKGRCIHDNLFILQNVTDYANIYNKDVAIIYIDQEKAFDRIEWVFCMLFLTKWVFPMS